MHLIIVFFIGALISFLGQLPLGNMALTATQISVQETFKKAWIYAVGVTLVEMAYLRLALSGVNWIMQHQLIFIILGWITVVVFLVLGLLSFIAARKQKKEHEKTILLNNKLNRFLLGLSLSAINPVQIPFWFIWSAYLLNNKILFPLTIDYNIFTIGAGLGTMLGYGVYIHGGNWLITKMKTSNKTMNKILGAIFIITALIQAYKMIAGNIFE